MESPLALNIIDCGVFQFDDVNNNDVGYNVTNNGVLFLGSCIDEYTFTFCVGFVSNTIPYDVFVPSMIDNGPTTFNLYSNPPPTVINCNLASASSLFNTVISNDFGGVDVYIISVLDIESVSYTHLTLPTKRIV